MSYKRVFGAKTPKNGDIGGFFAWRPFALPGKDTTDGSGKHNAWNVAYFRVVGQKVAIHKHEKVTIWRVFACALWPKKHAYTTWHKSAIILKTYLQDNEMVQFISRMPTTVMQVSQQEGEHLL